MSFQNLYVGLSPYNAPAVFSLLQALEFQQGIYYPIGGFTSISKSLESIARELGVEILTNSKVIRWNFESNTLASVAIRQHYNNSTGEDANTDVNDLIIKANKFVTNIDVPANEVHFSNVTNSISGTVSDYQDKRALESLPSCSVVQFHFALDREIQELNHHNVFFSSEYRHSWDTIELPNDDYTTKGIDFTKLNFYLHAPSRTDSSVCPKGHDALTILVPVPPLPDALMQARNGNPIKSIYMFQS